MDQRRWTVEAQEAWSNSKPEPKEKTYYVNPSYEDSIPFDGDSKLFVDADFDMISTDGFETIPNVRHKSVYSPVTGKLLGYKLIDVDLEEEILSRLLDADAPDFNLEMDIFAKSDARCQTRFDRMIVEDCTFTENSVEVPQLTQAGDCSVPNHLRIEQIAQFAGINYKQAHLMAQVLKSLDIDFRTWVLKPVYKKETNSQGDTYYTRKSTATRINAWARQAGKAPYEAPVGGQAIPLYKLAKAINDLERQPQEDQSGYEINREVGHMFDADFVPPKNEPDLEIPNPVGEYTYLKISRIPQSKEFNDSRWGMKPSAFKEIINRMDNMSNTEMADTWKEFEKAFSFEQKDRFMADWKRIACSRARAEFAGEITICEPMLEPPVEETEPMAIIENGFEEWQLEESRFELEESDDEIWKYSVSQDVIDELNSHFKIA